MHNHQKKQEGSNHNSNVGLFKAETPQGNLRCLTVVALLPSCVVIWETDGGGGREEGGGVSSFLDMSVTSSED